MKFGVEFCYNTSADERPINQGSPLSPALFNIQFNTLSPVAFKSPSYPVPEGFDCNRKKFISPFFYIQT
jgi:hypothetical protein